jgi:8-oxo-dGTP pyrophosphatase MutT (NUDIX family)
VKDRLSIKDNISLDVAASPHAAEVRQPEAAVAIVRTRGSDSILLMRRADREGDAWSGHWSLPGGRRAECDPDLLETAMRELQEECGIQLSREQMIAALPPAIARRRTGPFLLVAPFVFEVESELPTLLDLREAVEAVWFPRRTLLDPGQHSFQRVPGLPAQMWFPGIVLPGAPLWGFTYRLLVEWLDISPRGCTSSGFDVARMTLDFLLARGLTLRTAWHLPAAGIGPEPGPVQVAQVSGSIPEGAVIDYFAASGECAGRVNGFEVRPEYVRIYGLAFEQYLIEALAD